MPDETKRWTIEIDKVRFDELKSEERFWQLVALSRAANTLRFVQAALLAHPENSDSLQAKRTKFNSFFFTCALLYEAICSSNVCARISIKILHLPRCKRF